MVIQDAGCAPTRFVIPTFPELDKKVEVKPAELKMAEQVVQSMTDDFKPGTATTTTTRNSCTS